MTTTLRIILSVGIVLYFVFVIVMIRKKTLSLKYSLLWLLMGVVLLCLIIWPELLGLLCKCLGIVDTMNCLFTIALVFALIIIMSLTSIVSKQDEKLKVLVQQLGILEKEAKETNCQVEFIKKDL